MKPELSERLFVESLFNKSIETSSIPDNSISEIEKLTGDASTRRYYRVTTSKDKYVVCLGNPITNKSEKSDFVQVQSVLNGYEVRVPKIFDKNLNKGYILQEDLGDQTLLKRLSMIDSQAEELTIYKRVIDDLIKMHSIDVSKHKEESFHSLEFNVKKLMSEIEFAIEHFIEGLMNFKIDESEKRMITNEFEKICEAIAAEKKVFTHRDFHSRNIMVKGDELIFIDFQDARMGLPQYDLASLLDDCYYQLPRSTKFELTKYYWDNSPNIHSMQSSFEEFVELYNLMKIQRTFKALGSFGYIYGQRNDERYLKYIGFGFEKLKDVLFKHQKYKELRKSLMRIYYEY